MDLRNQIIAINPVMMLPFGLLLAAIALGPLLVPRWWERHYPKAVAALGVVVLAYYLGGLREWARTLETAHDYISFIAVVGSLYVISGGIYIAVKGEATPLTNVLFLLVGAVLANVLGTTGASMLLIRPWLRTNRYRVGAHHVLFFVFIVSNVGGSLTPLGPPLLLGYLKGVPFWWVAARGFPIWLAAVGILLAIFLLIDYRNYLRAPPDVRAEHASHSEEWRFDGLGNLFFMAVALGAVFVARPIFLREGLMIGAAVASYLTTSAPIHQSNHFSFGPIREVAILFAGIFATMMPALDWLQQNAAGLRHATPGFFFFSCGGLSGALDNAPTYLCFLKAAFGKFIDPQTVTKLAELARAQGRAVAAITGPHASQIQNALAAMERYHASDLASGSASLDEMQVAYLIGNPEFHRHLLAISFGSVFFGASTYIGNGPNFMIKAIADHQKVKTPTFLGYIARFTAPCLLPMFLIVWLLFFF